jgi:hypothetical protein
MRAGKHPVKEETHENSEPDRQATAELARFNDGHCVCV